MRSEDIMVFLLCPLVGLSDNSYMILGVRSHYFGWKGSMFHMQQRPCHRPSRGRAWAGMFGLQRREASRFRRHLRTARHNSAGARMSQARNMD